MLYIIFLFFSFLSFSSKSLITNMEKSKKFGSQRSWHYGVRCEESPSPAHLCCQGEGGLRQWQPFVQGMWHIGPGTTLLPPTRIQLSFLPEIIANMLFVRRGIQKRCGNPCSSFTNWSFWSLARSISLEQFLSLHFSVHMML